MSTIATGSKTTWNSRGVRIEITSVLDYSTAAIAAWATDRQDLYRIEVDDAVVGFIQIDDDGKWWAKSMGQRDAHALRTGRGHQDLDTAAHEAAEHFSGRTLR